MQYGFKDNGEKLKMTKEIKKYDIKKTIEKVLRVGAYVVILGLLAYTTEQPGLLFLVVPLEGARDYLKHRNK